MNPSIDINGVTITLTDEQLAQIAKQTEKSTKISKEDRFWGLCEGLIIKIDKVNYPSRISFLKDNECLFEYNSKNGYLWCNYYLVWLIFEEEYNMNYQQIQDFIKVVVEEHFNCKGITPQWVNDNRRHKSGRTFQL